MSDKVRETIPNFNYLKMALLLHHVPYIGPKQIDRALSRLIVEPVTPGQFLNLSPVELRERFGLTSRAIAYLLSHKEPLMEKAEALARVVRFYNLHCVTRAQLTYPARLETYDPSPPPILYGLGYYKLLDNSSRSFTFTILVSNGACEETYVTLERIASELIACKGIPVTGHDRLPYQRLALTAQRDSHPVIYLLDRGLREAMGEHFDQALFSAARIHSIDFCDERDLVLSPFRLDDHCLGQHNRRRDQLIIALSDVVVALDVRENGVLYQECLRAIRRGQCVCVAKAGREGNRLLQNAGAELMPSDFRTWLQTRSEEVGEL
ncbi:MAG TPA: hypothetical protein VKV18_09190 [Chthonomonas sp.]|uniref:hypothetical protein n=1 Tax=Chthonomonas sp. TaxID=2282153 RepID=UPI002B4B1287|nr:hypothetical protein [Chthonomonas sp.]HLI48846.1 hypothetical protein [Chthonomonas sp.]